MEIAFIGITNTRQSEAALEAFERGLKVPRIPKGATTLVEFADGNRLQPDSARERAVGTPVSLPEDLEREIVNAQDALSEYFAARFDAYRGWILAAE